MRKIISIIAGAITVILLTATSAMAATLWSGADPAGDVTSHGLPKKQKNAIDLTGGYIYKWEDGTKVTLQWNVKKFAKTDQNGFYELYFKGKNTSYAAVVRPTVGPNGVKFVQNLDTGKKKCSAAGTITTTKTSVKWSGIPISCFPKGKLKFTNVSTLIFFHDNSNTDIMTVNKTITIR